MEHIMQHFMEHIMQHFMEHFIKPFKEHLNEKFIVQCTIYVTLLVQSHVLHGTHYKHLCTTSWNI